MRRRPKNFGPLPPPLGALKIIKISPHCGGTAILAKIEPALWREQTLVLPTVRAKTSVLRERQGDQAAGRPGGREARRQGGQAAGRPGGRETR